jgi:ABC-type branched-subunit amino acid transport system ATPase component
VLDDVRVDLGDRAVLEGVTLEVAPGEVVGVIGGNGVGKTTLLDAVSGLAPATAGDLRLDGRSLDGTPPHERAHRGLGRTFQSTDLFEGMTAAEALALVDRPTRPAGAGCDVAEGLPDQLPDQLTSDDRRRLSIELALAAEPRILLLDEPAAGVSRSARAELSASIRRTADAGTAVVLCDHHVDFIRSTCDRVVLLHDGRVEVEGPTATVLADPRVGEVYLDGLAR